MSTTRSRGQSDCAMRLPTSTAAAFSSRCSASRSSVRRRRLRGRSCYTSTSRNGGFATRASGDDVPDARPVPVTGAVSQMFRDALASRGIEELPQHLVTSIDPTDRMARLATGETLPYDLFVGIPVHHAPEPLAASGLAVDGWVPVDQTNLRTAVPHVYALGDVCTGPRTVAKAGIFAEAAARVVADDITAEISGDGPAAGVRGVGRLLRRVRRRARQQGGRQLPSWRFPVGRASRSVARVRRREGRVRRSPPCAVVRVFVKREVCSPDRCAMTAGL